MSRQIALDTIWLKPTRRLAHMEFSLEYHTEYIRNKTRLDPAAPMEMFRLNNMAMRRLNELWGIDLIWSVDDGLHQDWARYGRSTNMGHAKYAANGSDMQKAEECPFASVEEVWSFDAVKEYGLPDAGEQVAAYERIVQNARENNPEQLVTGGYYKTIISGAIQAFGWNMLLMALSDPGRMEKVFDSFFRYTLFHMEAWAKTSAEVIIQHDDFVWTKGAFMRPEIYRKVIIPRYAELWKPLRAAGKKVLFCADGNFEEFAEDVVQAGADGLIFEPCNNFSSMVERFSQSTVLVGSAVDCRDMTFGTWDQVRASMDRTFELAHNCKGLIFAVGNHIPANVPHDMMDKYIDYLQANWSLD